MCTDCRGKNACGLHFFATYKIIIPVSFNCLFSGSKNISNFLSTHRHRMYTALLACLYSMHLLLASTLMLIRRQLAWLALGCIGSLTANPWDDKLSALLPPACYSDRTSGYCSNCNQLVCLLVSVQTKSTIASDG